MAARPGHTPQVEKAWPRGPHSCSLLCVPWRWVRQLGKEGLAGAGQVHVRDGLGLPAPAPGAEARGILGAGSRHVGSLTFRMLSVDPVGVGKRQGSGLSRPLTSGACPRPPPPGQFIVSSTPPVQGQVCRQEGRHRSPGIHSPTGRPTGFHWEDTVHISHHPRGGRSHGKPWLCPQDGGGAGAGWKAGLQHPVEALTARRRRSRLSRWAAGAPEGSRAGSDVRTGQSGS